jgi:hypothetical protein
MGGIILFDNKIFTDRLKNLLGDKYQFLQNRWSTEVPIEIKNNNFVAKACESPNCGWTDFIIVYNISNNVMSVGIRNEKKVSIFSEKTKDSELINEWAQGI